MATTEERIKGLETQTGNIRERLSNIEGQLTTRNSETTTSPISIALISIACTALLMYLGWLGVTVVNHGQQLSQIYALIAPEKLHQVASQPVTSENIDVANAILANAKKSGANLPTPVIIEVGQKFVSAAEKNPESWGAALNFLNYRSYLNTLEVSRPPNLVPKSQVDWKIAVNAESNNGPVADVTVFVSRMLVPVDQAARSESIGTNPNAETTEGPEHIVIVLDKGDSTTLDGFWYKNVILQNARVVYKGGPVKLENVRFVNCTFDFTDMPQSLKLADELFADTSATFTATS